MRGSIPEYAAVTASLYDLLEVAAKDVGSRKKKAASSGAGCDGLGRRA